MDLVKSSTHATPQFPPGSQGRPWAKPRGQQDKIRLTNSTNLHSDHSLFINHECSILLLHCTNMSLRRKRRSQRFREKCGSGLRRGVISSRLRLFVLSWYNIEVPNFHYATLFVRFRRENYARTLNIARGETQQRAQQRDNTVADLTVTSESENE